MARRPPAPPAPAVGEEGMEEFRRAVREAGRRHWRDLPWRNIDDDYGVLVSEVMLQQTQVKRVLGYWPRFMGMFPTIDALAAADNAVVLGQWQGLGYNRRALLLKRAAEECSARGGGRLPRDYPGLIALPGIGPATAAGVMAFAHDEPCVYLETNVRSVFLHHFFPHQDGVDDRQLAPLVRAACPKSGVREWYYALLDYGAHLKKEVANPSRKSRHHAVQAPFEGSRRQKRAFIVRSVLGEPGISRADLAERLDSAEAAAGRPQVEAALFDALVGELAAEGFFSEEGGRLLP